ncbi:MAG: alpha-glucosidase/alpha-galactosidase [Planctomycetota bacterium]
MPKVTLMGAGSGFTPRLFCDIMQIPDIDGGTIGLVDLDRERLRLSAGVVEIIADKLGKADAWTIHASTDRKKVLPGTDYLINCIEVSGTKTVRHDYRIAKKFGVDQCIGDTTGPGGIMKAFRTIPPWLEIVRHAEELCPDALILNYTNPMSMMSFATVRSTDMPYVGLCHSVQGTSKALARYAGVPYEEMKWRCGGINHMAWFTRLEHEGKDLYPVLREKLKRRAQLNKKPLKKHDPVRFDLMLHFGYFNTESSGHMSEYVPYYRKREDLIDKYCGDRYEGGRGFYAREWPKWRRHTDRQRQKILDGKAEPRIARSHEYASRIIAAHLKNQPDVIHGSVENNGLIDNLPAEGVVEVEVLVDHTGYHPCRFGPLPPQVAALCDSNMRSFECAVKSILEEDPDLALHAFLLDPLTAAVCCPAEIERMFLQLLRAEKDYVPKYLQQVVGK